MFNERVFQEKLKQLNSTQESIETIANWCLFHRRNAQAVVTIWKQHLMGCETAQKLPMLYLANDILQKSRRRGSEFVEAFWPIMPPALAHASYECCNDTRVKLRRLVSVWEERLVFGTSTDMNVLRNAIDSGEHQSIWSVNETQPQNKNNTATAVSNSGANDDSVLADMKTAAVSYKSSIPVALSGAVEKVRAAERANETSTKAEKALSEKENQHAWALENASVQEAASSGTLRELDQALVDIDGSAKPLLHALKSESEAKAECATTLRSIADSYAEQAQQLEQRWNEVASRQQQLRMHKRAAEQAWNAQMYFAQRMGTTPPEPLQQHQLHVHEEQQPTQNQQSSSFLHPFIHGSSAPQALNEPTTISWAGNVGEGIQSTTTAGNASEYKANNEEQQEENTASDRPAYGVDKVEEEEASLYGFHQYAESNANDTSAEKHRADEAHSDMTLSGTHNGTEDAAPPTKRRRQASKHDELTGASDATVATEEAQANDYSVACE